MKERVTVILRNVEGNEISRSRSSGQYGIDRTAILHAALKAAQDGGMLPEQTKVKQLATIVNAFITRQVSVGFGT